MKDFTITHIGDTALSLPMPFKFIPAKGKTFMFQADDGSNLGIKSDGVPITFENDFWMCAYQTTQEFWEVVTKHITQFLKAVSDTGNQIYEQQYTSNPSYFKGKTRPVENINYNQINQFIEYLNFLLDTNAQIKFKDSEKPRGKFKLPSETQWEYAAEAGQDLVFAGSQNLNDVGWYNENSNDQTMPVGLKQPNAWGLYDMSGNVFEWCADDYVSNPKPIPQNGMPYSENGYAKSLRGGSCCDFAEICRIRFRSEAHSQDRDDSHGFRLVFALSSTHESYLAS